MKNRVAWGGLAAAVLAMAAFAWVRSRERAADALDLAPIAAVDGQALTAGRFTRSYLEHLLATGRNDTPSERYRHLDRLVRAIVLAKEARRLGLDRSGEYAALLDRVERLSVGAQYFEEAFAASQGPLTEREAREAFEHSRESVAIRHLFFRDPREAQAAWEALEAGADFRQLARDLYGTAQGDSSAGWLGFASYWDLDDAVADVAYDLPVGRHSEPVRSRFGWHILRVEERLVSPILTESDFQMHRAGIEGRALVRRNRLAGDAFIRSMMEALDVRVDADGARALVDAVQGAVAVPAGAGPTAEASQRARVLVTRAEVERVRRALSPGTLLATYDLDRSRARFTAGDFVHWLPELPYDEVRDRTMAAVGRALRNEVLAHRGRRRGFENRPLVREAVRFAADTWLAERMRDGLRVSGRVKPTDEEVAAAFEELGFRTLEEAEADWWAVRTATLAEAESIRRMVDAGSAPDTLPGFERHERSEVRGDGLAGHVRRAPQGQTVVGCEDDGGCFVLRVERRALRYTRLEDRADEIRSLLERVLPEERLADSLLATVDVRVDTLLFRRLMEAAAPRR